MSQSRVRFIGSRELHRDLPKVLESLEEPELPVRPDDPQQAEGRPDRGRGVPRLAPRPQPGRPPAGPPARRPGPGPRIGVDLRRRSRRAEPPRKNSSSSDRRPIRFTSRRAPSSRPDPVASFPSGPVGPPTIRRSSRSVAAVAIDRAGIRDRRDIAAPVGARAVRPSAPSFRRPRGGSGRPGAARASPAFCDRITPGRGAVARGQFGAAGRHRSAAPG